MNLKNGGTKAYSFFQKKSSKINKKNVWENFYPKKICYNKPYWNWKKNTYYRLKHHY